MDNLTATLLLLLLAANNKEISIKDSSKIVEKTKENHIWLTDEFGIVNPKTVINLQLENPIKIVTTDGEKFDGVVKVVKFENEILKIFGDINNKPNAAFGFGLTKSGSFAGAVILKDEDYGYIIEFSEKHNGFIYVKKSKNDKKQVATK